MEKDDEIVIDGETEVDDLLLASKFAELENIKYESILSEAQKNNNKTKCFSNILTDNEEELSESSSDSENNEFDDDIVELIKNEMRYRYKGKYSNDFLNNNESGCIEHNEFNINQDNNDMSTDGSGKLSNEYLSKFGIVLEDNGSKKSKNEEFENLDDIDDFDDLSDDNMKVRKEVKEKLNEKNKVDIDGIRSWLPNIEVVDMPEKVEHYLPCEYVGDIYSRINDKQVNGTNDIYIIKSDPSGIILDLGSVLCLEDKTIIGTIIDTFGPINSPFYVLNKQDKIDASILDIGTKIYCDRKHSTILGKGGKVKQSRLSETSVKNRINIPLNKKSVHSLFLNKEFVNETSKKSKVTNDNNSGSELEDGEDNCHEDESGDDIGYGKTELSGKKFTERYDNLGLVQESCIEDTIDRIRNTNNTTTKHKNAGNIKCMKQKGVNKIKEINDKNIRKIFHNNVNNALNIHKYNRYQSNHELNNYNNHNYINRQNNGTYPNMFIYQTNQMGRYYNNGQIKQTSQNGGIFQNHIEGVYSNSTTQPIYSKSGQDSRSSNDTSIMNFNMHHINTSDGIHRY
ncbi:hypothetical protein FG379_000919 [Cryptosporidium bovis]|uniref:uncharacterized protein n=1 Tax=Cryptosporidium bovis TaxID=310047 RepID=UPI00351A1040|nr:hypothetical protein FG379_000919 [Cryptosporidium bovis]